MPRPAARPPTGPDAQPAHHLVQELRRQRRAFVQAAHPDRGGDPDAFRDGLAHFQARLDQAGGATSSPAGHPGGVIVGRRSGTLLGRLRSARARRAARLDRRARLR